MDVGGSEKIRCLLGVFEDGRINYRVAGISDLDFAGVYGTQ